jgi:hypothetical protein
MAPNDVRENRRQQVSVAAEISINGLDRVVRRPTCFKL